MCLLQKVDFLARSVSRNIALLEDEELVKISRTTDLSQKHITV